MNILAGISSLKLFGNYTNSLMVLLIILLSLSIWRKKKIQLNTNLIVLIAFSITYYINLLLYSQDVSEISLFCIISYFIGILIICLSKNINKDIKIYIYSIALGFFIHAMLNYFTNLGTTNRNTIDIWRKTVKSATLQATMLTMIMGTSFFSLFCVKKRLYKIILGICIILSLCYDMVLATRTLLVVSIISFVVSWIIFINSKENKKYLFKSIIILLVFIEIITIIFVTNLGGIREKIEDSNLVKRINRTDTINSDKSRVNTFFLSIKTIFDYPFGGNNDKIGNLKYSHNMWLDVAKEAGIIPFLLLCLFFIINLRNLIKIILNKKEDLNIKILLVGLYVAVLLNLSVEPILQGEPLFLIMFCMIMGMVDTKVYFTKSDI